MKRVLSGTLFFLRESIFVIVLCMEKDKYYSSGQFAKKARVSLRTIRFYDQKNILKPSFRNENGNRYYTDDDLAKLQQILLFKYLGFSLEDIREFTLASMDPKILMNSLQIQKKLIQERIENMQSMTNAIDHTMRELEEHQSIDWKSMLSLIDLTAMESSMKSQYVNSSNINARIRLHNEYSKNTQGWFPWIYEQCHIQENMRILEIGCGNGELWKDHLEDLPNHVHITLMDISEGMIRDVKRILKDDHRFAYVVGDCQKLDFQEKFDLIIANHVMFYLDDIPKVLNDCAKLLKENGMMLVSTYGKNHMKEITELVQSFNSNIMLSKEALYERFGIENGEEILRQSFSLVELKRYEDAIEVDEVEPLISYILSCHGNQNQLLLDHYKEFHTFVSKKVSRGFGITKDAGVFICKN